MKYVTNFFIIIYEHCLFHFPENRNFNAVNKKWFGSTCNFNYFVKFSVFCLAMFALLSAQYSTIVANKLACRENQKPVCVCLCDLFFVRVMLQPVSVLNFDQRDILMTSVTKTVATFLRMPVGMCSYSSSHG